MIRLRDPTPSVHTVSGISSEVTVNYNVRTCQVYAQSKTKALRIPVPTRLRRAILLNDLVLAKRIIRNDPDVVQNPDFDDKSNTSLHLCAKLGLLEIAVRSQTL